MPKDKNLPSDHKPIMNLPAKYLAGFDLDTGKIDVEPQLKVVENRIKELQSNITQNLVAIRCDKAAVPHADTTWVDKESNMTEQQSFERHRQQLLGANKQMMAMLDDLFPERARLKALFAQQVAAKEAAEEAKRLAEEEAERQRQEAEETTTAAKEVEPDAD